MSGSVGAVAVNNAGGGNIAGIGVGPQGEPGVDLKKKKTPILFKNIEKRKTPIMVKEETFAGHTVFTVDSDTFHNSRLGKRKYARWINYVGDDEIGQMIKSYGYKYPTRPIILKNHVTGAMCWLRYPNAHRAF